MGPAFSPSVVAALATLAPAGPAAPEVGLADLLRTPEHHLGQVVTTTVQFREDLPTWEPYLSGIAPATHDAFTAWADAQLLWEEDQYRNAPGLFFTREGTPIGDFMSGAKSHERYQLQVRVDCHVAGRAWIEVLGATRTIEQVPEGTVLHAVRAYEMLEKGAIALARSEFEKALAAPLPAHVRWALEQDVPRAARGEAVEASARR